jgi:hypothetical protein
LYLVRRASPVNAEQVATPGRKASHEIIGPVIDSPAFRSIEALAANSASRSIEALANSPAMRIAEAYVDDLLRADRPTVARPTPRRSDLSPLDSTRLVVLVALLILMTAVAMEGAVSDPQLGSLTNLFLITPMAIVTQLIVEELRRR